MRKRNLLIYSGFDFLNKGLPFLMIPFFTHYLNPEEYGRLELYLLVFGLSQLIIWFNQNTYFQKNYFLKDNKNYLVASVVLPFFLFIVTLVFLFFSGILQSRILAVYIASVAFLSLSYQIFLLEKQLLEKAISFGLTQFFVTLISLAISVMLVLGDFGATGRFIGITLTPALIGLYILVRSWANQNSQKSSSFINLSIQKPLSFGLKLLPHNIINGWLRDSAPKLIILYLSSSTHVLGIYSVTFSFALVINILINSSMQVIRPYIYKREVEGGIALKELLWILILFVLIFVLGAPLLYLIFPLVVDEQFLGYSKMIFLISGGFVFGGLSAVLETILIAKNRPDRVSYNSTVSVLLSVAIIVFSVHFYDAPVTVVVALYAASFIFTATLNFWSCKEYFYDTYHHSN